MAVPDAYSVTVEVLTDKAMALAWSGLAEGEVPIEIERASLFLDDSGALCVTEHRLLFTRCTSRSPLPMRLSIPMSEVAAAELGRRVVMTGSGRVIGVRLHRSAFEFRFKLAVGGVARSEKLRDLVNQLAPQASSNVSPAVVHSIDAPLEVHVGDGVAAAVVRRGGSLVVEAESLDVEFRTPTVTRRADAPLDAQLARFEDVEPFQLWLDEALVWFNLLSLSVTRRGKVQAHIHRG